MKLCREGLHWYTPVPGSHKGCLECRKIYVDDWYIKNKKRTKNNVKSWQQFQRAGDLNELSDALRTIAPRSRAQRSHSD